MLKVMKRRRIIKALCAGWSGVVLAFVLSACQPEGLVDFQPHTFSAGYWHKDSALRYTLHVQDTAVHYAMCFFLKHGKEYPNANLYLFVQVQSPLGGVQFDTLNYYLATPQGKWLGQGIGAEKKLLLPYTQAMHFNAPGEYTFVVRHGMRYDSLQDIHQFGFQLYHPHD